MNLLILTLLAWLFLGLEQGLKDALALSSLGVAPSFVFVLLAFIAMSAPKSTTFWCAAFLGIAMDLLFKLPMREGTGTITLVGPHPLAYALGCQLIISMRGLMMRRNPLTLAFLAFVGSLVAFLVLDAIFTLRHAAGAPIAWEARRQLVAGVGSSLYTGVLAIPLSFALFPLTAALGLPDPKARWGATRRT